MSQSARYIEFLAQRLEALSREPDGFKRIARLMLEESMKSTTLDTENPGELSRAAYNLEDTIGIEMLGIM